MLAVNRRWATRRRSLRSRSRGTAIVYVMVILPIAFGFCTLGLDAGHCELVKTQLQGIADAAARAGARNIPNGSQAVINAAVAMAAANYVNGSHLTLNTTTDIQFIKWVSTGNYSVVTTANFSQANAVRVYAHQTAAEGSAVGLWFGGFIGLQSSDVTASAIAMYSRQSSTQYVPTTGNPWLAGEPTGTIGSVTDSAYEGPNVNPEHPWQHDIAGPFGGHLASGQAYDSPDLINITINPGASINLTNVSGQGSNDPDLPMYDATGQAISGGGGVSIAYDWAATGSPAGEHGMSDINAPHNAMIGVFLDNNVPDNDGAVPAALDFTSQTARDYTTLSPLLKQTFYIGDGLTSTGLAQTVIVPAGATRLFIGTMDGHEWSNNLGGFTGTFSQTRITMVQ